MYMKEIQLKKWGNSQGIRIGKDELEALGEDSTQLTFEMVIENGKIILTPKKNVPTTLNELFADYGGEPLSEGDKFDWGNSVGRELL